MAGTTGLEPATSDVTGRRSNQLSYVPALPQPLQINIAAGLFTTPTSNYCGGAAAGGGASSNSVKFTSICVITSTGLPFRSVVE